MVIWQCSAFSTPAMAAGVTDRLWSVTSFYKRQSEEN